MSKQTRLIIVEAAGTASVAMERAELTSRLARAAFSRTALLETTFNQLRPLDNRHQPNLCTLRHLR
jgi:hypothetical protein